MQLNRVYKYLLSNSYVLFPNYDEKIRTQLIMTLFKKAEDKLESKTRRRRQKAIKQIKNDIDPKIDHNVKNTLLDGRIFNTMGQFESNKFCKML